MISDLTHMMEKGNHKSVSDPENEPTLLKNYQKEVDHDWMLPVTMEYVSKIPGASARPVGVAPQFIFNTNGDRKVKRRTTHDASFNLLPKSINNRMNRDLLVHCFYGHCLIRILHAIHIMRSSCPGTGIYISKLDLDAAYRRLHMLVEMEVMMMTIIKR